MKIIEGYTPDQLLRQCEKMNDLMQYCNKSSGIPGIRSPEDLLAWLNEKGKYENWIYDYMVALRYDTEIDAIRAIKNLMCPIEALNIDPENMKLSVKPEYLK
ncbi:hypothetical protein ES705_14804 [subsurface metagenome]